ncbi:MAG TPA: FGLLP motif-containing membrane protein [Candidatus Saccharimonadales bacterium]|nr:FGLLP motif-containing membrane protein [Candidatus Saccharimonadales bacterium]
MRGGAGSGSDNREDGGRDGDRRVPPIRDEHGVLDMIAFMHRRAWMAVSGVGCAVLAVALVSRNADAGVLNNLLSERFVPVPASMLPPTGTVYDDATCPTDSRCYVVGAGADGGIVTITDDGGRSWESSTLPSTRGFDDFSISCPSASTCYAGGSDLRTTSAILATRNGGRSWTRGVVPRGVIIDSIGCGSPTACVAVGSANPEAFTPSSVVSTTDGGATWVEHAAPAGGLTTVRCLDSGHCWVAGPGAWFSSDLGASWTDMSPPSAANCPPGGGICDNVWSRTVDIEFQSIDDGWIVGELTCGRGGCEAAALHTADGGKTWTSSNAVHQYPLGYQIACQGAACIFVGQGETDSVIADTVDAGGGWSTMQHVASFINALACTPDRTLCLVAGGRKGARAALLILGAPSPAGPSILSTVGGSLASPAALLGAPLNALVNALITVGLILLITFPSQLFNHTYEENHERIRAFWQRRLTWFTGARAIGDRLSASRRATLSVICVVVAGGVLAAMLDPGFGLNVRSLALFLGAVLALVAGATVTALASGVYRMTRHRVGVWHVRALPSALLVAAGCVLVSRVTNFQPGYLYGLIGGVIFSGPLTSRQEGHEVAVASTCTLVVSIVAWLIWAPVATAATGDPSSFALAMLENFLAALFLTGMVGLVIGLIPLRFLPGERLAQWRWGAWALLFGLAMVAVIEVVIRPQTSIARGRSEPFWTTLGLFLAFGVASVLFWLYFQVRREPGPSPAT